MVISIQSHSRKLFGQIVEQWHAVMNSGNFGLGLIITAVLVGIIWLLLSVMAIG